VHATEVPMVVVVSFVLAFWTACPSRTCAQSIAELAEVQLE